MKYLHLLRLLYAPVIWVTVTLSTTTLAALGFPLVVWKTFAEAYTYRDSKFPAYGWVSAWKDKWMWVFGNEEDGVVPPGWYAPKAPWRRRIIQWTGLRNSTNNLRFTWLGCKIDPPRIWWVGNSQDPHRDLIHDWMLGEDGVEPVPYAAFPPKRVYWYFAGQGWLYSNVWIITKIGAHFYEFRWGWRVLPKDITNPLSPTDARAYGAGHTIQLRREM